MSIKISQLTAIGSPDVTTYSSSVIFPLVANVTGNLVTYQTGIASIKNYVTSSDTVFAANVTAANLIANTGIFGTLKTSAQPSITSLGSLTSLTVLGNISCSYITGNIRPTAGTGSAGIIFPADPGGGSGDLATIQYYASAGESTVLELAVTNDADDIIKLNATGGTTVTNTLTADYFKGNGSLLNSITAGNISGTVANATYAVSSSLADYVAANAQANITSVGTLTSLTVSGTLTTASIIPSSNNVSNIGDSTHWYNRIFSVSTEALYADLAEKYIADADYESGTVVVFGGDKEITVTNQFADTRVAGIISTDPAYIMNAGIDGLPVALRGRVPCKVIGPVAKGDLLVTSDVEGYAKSLNQNQEWAVTFNIDAGNSVFAKSLENNDTAGPTVIEAVVV